jgi:hypothetical protein
VEDMAYAKVKKKVIKPKTKVSGETGPEFSSDEELRAQFSTTRNRKKETRKHVANNRMYLNNIFKTFQRYFSELNVILVPSKIKLFCVINGKESTRFIIFLQLFCYFGHIITFSI